MGDGSGWWDTRNEGVTDGDGLICVAACGCVDDGAAEKDGCPETELDSRSGELHCESRFYVESSETVSGSRRYSDSTKLSGSELPSTRQELLLIYPIPSLLPHPRSPKSTTRGGDSSPQRRQRMQLKHHKHRPSSKHPIPLSIIGSGFILSIP